MIELASILLRQRTLIARTAVATFVTVVSVTLMLPRSFSAVGSFLPYASEATPGGAAGLAAQFGLMIGGAGGGQSPEFYSELIRSREFLGRVAESRFDVVIKEGVPFFRDTVTRSGSLVDVLEIDEDSPTAASERAIEKLRDILEVSTGRLSGTVTVRATTPSPGLSRQLAASVISFVDDFNRTRRQSQANAERAFIEERLAGEREALRRSESTLEDFLRRNRVYASSPELVFQHDRLQRDVALRQQVLLSLAQGFEQARMEEVRNTPVITVVQQPEAPALPDRRRLLLKGLLALVGGTVIGSILAFLRDLILASRQADPRRFGQFQELWYGFTRELRRPWQLLRKDRHPT